MLSKLLKHELKATARYLIPLYLILIMFSVIDRIVLRLDIFTGTFQVIKGFLTFFYILSIAAIIIVTFIIMILRFYKNLVTDEGYLMFTLPVKPYQLINSKLYVSVLWIAFSILAVIGSIFFVVANPETMGIFWEGFKDSMAELRNEFGGSYYLFIIEMVILTVIGIVNSILLIYVSVAVGQLFSRHKIVGSFAAYMGISTIMQIVATIGFIIMGTAFNKEFSEIGSIPQYIFPALIIYLLIFSALFYWLTNYLFNKNLNLE